MKNTETKKEDLKTEPTNEGVAEKMKKEANDVANRAANEIDQIVQHAKEGMQHDACWLLFPHWRRNDFTKVFSSGLK